jgi:phosphoglycolate phosphatase-like HAD superfamily hydrolase
LSLKNKFRKLVLFDIDGTLVNVYGAGRKALEEAYRDVFERDDAAAHLDPVWFAGKTDLYIFRQVAINAGIPAWEYERRYAELESVYLERLRSNVAEHREKVLLPGVKPLLESLAERSEVALGLMTGNLEPGARIKLEPWELNRYFPSGGFGSDAPERSDIGRVARERYERRLSAAIDPAEVLVVGDTIHDILAARACGFGVLAVATGWTDTATLGAAAPDALLENLSDTREVLEIMGVPE